MSEITIRIERDKLPTYTSEFLSTAWHVAQANPAPIEDRDAGELAEAVGREIIRRWLKDQEPPLHSHQGCHHFWMVLQKHGKWVDGEWQPEAAQPSPSLEYKCTGCGAKMTYHERDKHRCAR